MNKRNALGRGLDSLISMDDTPARGSSAINEVPVDSIKPNPGQPRRDFDKEALEELANSISQLGIIQPLSLRSLDDGTYQIIAGERRYRAAQLAGLTSVPAYIRQADEVELTEMALIENIQREDLNAIEIALSFRKLIEQHGLTQEKLSERLGKKRATIANFLRLLRLPAQVQMGLRDRRVDMGHARALLAVPDPGEQLSLYERIVREGLSVRQVEQLAKELSAKATPEPQEKPLKAKEKGTLSRDFESLRQHLSARFSTNVGFVMDRKGRGRITFPFKDEQQLARIITLFDQIENSPQE